MAELGSIYEEDPRSGARGRDLRVEVRYPSWALGDADGAWVEVADELPSGAEACWPWRPSSLLRTSSCNSCAASG